MDVVDRLSELSDDGRDDWQALRGTRTDQGRVRDPTSHVFGQRRPVQQLHRKARLLVVAQELQHVDHVRVRDLLGRPHLLAEPLTCLLVARQFGQQPLDCALAVQVLVEAAEHLAHAPATEQSQHAEATEEQLRRR